MISLNLVLGQTTEQIKKAGSAIIGGISFEGSLLYYDENPSDTFKPNQIRAVFARLVGFERVPFRICVLDNCSA